VEGEGECPLRNRKRGKRGRIRLKRHNRVKRGAE